MRCTSNTWYSRGRAGSRGRAPTQSTIRDGGGRPTTRQAPFELRAKGDVQDINWGISVAVPLELSVRMVSELEVIILHLDGIVPPATSHTQDTVGGQTPASHTPVQQVAPGLQTPLPAPVLAPQTIAAAQQIANPVEVVRVTVRERALERRSRLS